MKKRINALLSLDSRLLRFEALGERPPKGTLTATGHHGGVCVCMRAAVGLPPTC